MSGRVLVFHAVDTEGPLYESAEETVRRINRITGLRFDPSEKTLASLKRGEGIPAEFESTLKLVLHYSHLLGDWSQVKSMLARIMSDEFRKENADSFGLGWVYNWHVMDHVGYDTNPRRRDIGYHNIFDTYQSLLKENGGRDQLGFHFHPDHFYSYAHLCGASFSTSKSLYQILTRRLVDRNWFPQSFRAGFHTERPDSNLFLEQWIPHDFSNQSVERTEEEQKQKDLASYRLGDWTRAQREWGAYHPHHDDYQRPGNCRRKIFRCLNVGTRIRCITPQEVDQAFLQAARTHQDVLLAVTNHDFRDMAPDVIWMKKELDRASLQHDIPWKAANIEDTFAPIKKTPVTRNWKWETKQGSRELRLDYEEKIFGPQAFLGIKLKNEIYHHVNFDIIEPFRSFSYTFDGDTVPLDMVEAIVVGTNDNGGNVLVDRVYDSNK